MVEFIGEDNNDLTNKQREFIIKVIEERGFKNGKITMKKVGEAGDNYVANVKRITTEKDGKTLNMIAKIAPTNEMMRNSMNIPHLFLNEFTMYNEVLPKFTELEKAADIPEKERLRYAVLYGASMEAENEVILLEDLNDAGFTMLDRFVSLTDQSVKVFLKSFAKLHTLSYVLKNREPEKFAEFATKVVNLWDLFQQTPETMTYFDQLGEDAAKLLDQEKYKKLVLEAMKQMMPNYEKLVKADRGRKHSVMQQGDPWTNNCMFLLEDGKAVDCCMIDYQISKEASPVADLHYMLFNCTDYETRSKHFSDWIDYYHSELDKYLSNFTIKANYVFPRDKLDADLRSYAKFSLAQAVMLATILVKENADAAEFKSQLDENFDMENWLEKSRITAANAITIQRFKTRVEGVIDSMSELGYL